MSRLDVKAAAIFWHRDNMNDQEIKNLKEIVSKYDTLFRDETGCFYEVSHIILDWHEVYYDGTTEEIGVPAAKLSNGKFVELWNVEPIQFFEVSMVQL